MTHYYAWKNNDKRKQMYGKSCIILARGTQNSRLIQFESGDCEIVSGNSIRKLKVQ